MSENYKKKNQFFYQLSLFDILYNKKSWKEGSFEIYGSSCIYNGVVEVPTTSVDLVVNAYKSGAEIWTDIKRLP